MQFTITHWGCTPSGDSIYLFRLTNATGASIELTNLGATWVSANMPNRYDVFENILLGYDHAEGYLKDTYYMGATVGRFANRIHQASFSIEGTTYLLEKNDGENTNHGGLSGFHKKIWQWKRTDSGIRFLLHSPDMEGGYPGNVQAEVEYQFTETNELTISYHGTTDRPTYLNLTNHAYFNSSGQAYAQRYLPGMKGVELRGGFAGSLQSPVDWYTGFAVSGYTKRANHWVAGVEYLLKNYGYRGTSVPRAQFTAEGGYYLKFLSDPAKIFFLSVGGSALVGYETLNWGEKVLYDGSMLSYRDAFVYGGALTLELESYVTDRIVLLAHVRERVLWGSSLGKFTTQFGLGVRFIIN